METFCLKLGEFDSNIREYFLDLEKEQNGFDVTLASEDGTQFGAHKIILSAGSTFFNDIIKESKHSSPFIYLKGINKSDLTHIINFLYRGEVNLNKPELQSFLETAKTLKVKGLQNKDKNNLEGKNVFNLSNALDNEILQFVSEKEQPSEESSLKFNIDQKDVEIDVVDGHGDIDDTMDSFVVWDTSKIVRGDLDVDTKIELMIEKAENCLRCKVCGKTAVDRSQQRINLKQHVETHIKDVRYECQFCGKTITTRPALKKHIRTAHRNL